MRRAEGRRPRIDGLVRSPQSEGSFHSDSQQTDWSSFRSPHSHAHILPSPTDSQHRSMSGSSNSHTHPSGSETLTTPPSSPISRKAYDHPTNHEFPSPPSATKPPGMTTSARSPTHSSSFSRRFPRRRTSKVGTMRSSWVFPSKHNTNVYSQTGAQTLSSSTSSHPSGSRTGTSSSLAPSVITPHTQVSNEQKKSRYV
jgi:hypothetical protein